MIQNRPCLKWDIFILLAGLSFVSPFGVGGANANAAESPGPVIFFTDILSGPNTGGENNNGIYLSIFGRGFGSSRGSSTVTINETEVTSYTYWGSATSEVTGLQQISVQPGPNVSSGIIKVAVDGKNSNLDHTFTVRNYSSKIWFVATDGDQFTCVANDINHPCANLNDTHKTKAKAGDFIVIRGGTYTDDEWVDFRPGESQRCSPPRLFCPRR